MPNPKILSDLLKAAGKLPKGSPAAREAVGAKIAAEKAEKAALYKAQPIATETGRKAIAQSKQTLMTPEQQAKMEAELREKGKQKFLEPSKVKDRVYHGTTSTDVARPEDAIAEFRGKRTWFSSNPEYANIYAGPETESHGIGGYVLPLNVQLTNPKIFPATSEGFAEWGKNSKSDRALKTEGYDGVIFLDKHGNLRTGYVFDPTQVKSAIGNIGTYDITTPDITKKDGGLAMATGGQAFPLQEEFQSEIERRAARPRTRAGVPVEDTNVLGGALQGLGETLLGGGRGALATTLGGPADILNLLNVKQFGTPDIPYGSEFFKEKMPLAPTTQTGKTAQQLGEFLPINPEQPIQAGVAGARKAGKALAPTMADMLEMQLQKSGMMMPVIKPEGGNWVRNAAEKYVEPLRMRMHEKDPVQTIAELETKYGKEAADQMLASGFYPNIREHAAINNFIDKKLTKYIRNEMATPSDPVRLQADQWAETKTKLLADKQKQIDKVQADIQKAQRERNVEPEVLTRSQARLRELQKEKALIKNRKGLHFEPRDVLPPIERRKEAGFPKTFAKTKVGSSWEDISDLAIRADPYMNQPEIGIGKTYAELKGNVPEEYLREINAALDKLGGKFAMENPETLAYRTSLQPNYLGFDHLIDELRGALSNEALPESLRLTTKTLDKMSVPQAIEHVDKINAWRASQKAEADAARAANQATVVHKEYPEAGLKWVELKAPDFNSLPLEERKAMVERLREEAKQKGLSPEAYIEKYPEQVLQDALKYEGEMLKHCVGGYCPDVMSGKSRIFSLRDEAGRPHATIEVQPINTQKAISNLPREEREALAQEVKDKYFGGVMPGRSNENEYWELLDQAFVEKYGMPPSSIEQIKGESNRAPSKEVEPYVQDFVKSGQWSHVGDISNAGLMQSKNAPWRQRFEEAGIDVPEYFSEKDYQDLVKQYFEKTSTPMDPKFMYETYGIQMAPEGGAPNMAEGGSVHPAVEKFAASLPHPAVTAFENRVIDLGDMITGGSAVDLSNLVAGSFANGGAVYNTIPDVSDAEKMLQGPAF